VTELVVTRAGLARLTDLGRRAAHLGFGQHGALDELAARTANALVGNVDDAPVVEVTAHDLSFTVSGDTVLAVTGAEARVSVAGIEQPTYGALHVPADSPVDVRLTGRGLRAYLAVAGSFRAEHRLGSCAPDAVLGIDGTLAPDSVVPLNERVAPRRGALGGVTLVRVRVEPPRLATLPAVPVTPGPDVRRFRAALETLAAHEYTMSTRSDAVGVRLDGPAPLALPGGEVRSSGVPVGAVEVPGDDGVIALHRGRGVTAGYLIPAVVTRHGLDVLAQVRPGERVRFVEESAAESVRRYRGELAACDVLRERARRVLAAQFDVAPG
jgi:5-oxoprolinase (ATP-hydrolysing) subunit C